MARLFTGAPPQNNLIPINSFLFARDTIIVQHYLGKAKKETLSFLIRSIVPPSKRTLDLGRQQLYVFDHHIDRRTFILGTDHDGRDIFSRLLVAIRTSLMIGLAAVILSFCMGILLGVFVGYYRRGLAAIVMYLINTFSTIPSLLLIFGITIGLGRGVWQIVVAIGFTMGISTTRIIRDQVRTLSELEFIKATKAVGFSDMRIIIRHIFPNLAGQLAVIAISSCSAAILIEAGLSFLGIGVQSPIPSLGLMAREHATSLINRPILILLPGIVVVLLACALNTLANALRHLHELDTPNRNCLSHGI